MTDSSQNLQGIKPEAYHIHSRHLPKFRFLRSPTNPFKKTAPWSYRHADGSPSTADSDYFGVKTTIIEFPSNLKQSISQHPIQSPKVETAVEGTWLRIHKRLHTPRHKPVISLKDGQTEAKSDNTECLLQPTHQEQKRYMRLYRLSYHQPYNTHRSVMVPRTQLKTIQFRWHLA